jgi:hypothetical protein
LLDKLLIKDDYINALQKKISFLLKQLLCHFQHLQNNTITFYSYHIKKFHSVFPTFFFYFKHKLKPGSCNERREDKNKEQMGILKPGE